MEVMKYRDGYGWHWVDSSDLTVEELNAMTNLNERLSSNTAEEVEDIKRRVAKQAIVDKKKEQAMRFNEGKPKLSLVDLTCLEPAARVLEYGSVKNERDNWKKGMTLSAILDSLLRHVACLQRGETIDPESGLPHVGHIQRNALFLGNPNVEIDIAEDNFNVTKE